MLGDILKRYKTLYLSLEEIISTPVKRPIYAALAIVKPAFGVYLVFIAQKIRFSAVGFLRLTAEFL